MDMTRKWTKLTEQQVEWAAQEYQAGRLSARAAARELGVGPNTVADAIRSRGIELTLKHHYIGKANKGNPSPRKGVTLSAETIAKRTASLKASDQSWRFGRPVSEETKQKLRDAMADLYESRRKYTDEQRRDIERLRGTCKRFIRRMLKFTGKRKTMPTAEYLGYDYRELREHLGPHIEGHEVDHIVPVAEFFRRGIIDPAAINALVNLRLLPVPANRRKSGRVPDNADEIIELCLEAAARAAARR